MMITSYTLLEQLHEGSDTVVHRGMRKADKLAVVLKAPKNPSPGPREVAKLIHQYEIIKDIHIPGIIAAYDMERHQDGAWLVLEDFDGCSLQSILATRTFDLCDILQIGIELADTLAALHQQNIIHKDIKPHNIILNIKTGQVKITDFGIATRLAHESQTGAPPRMLEGTLAYISPEQTGRMNRSIDHRSDLYSLGVTLYEMLTGMLPFQSTEPLELVHSHIARRPLAPHELSPAIPQVVSDIIMKLLAKTAEDRYQQAEGLKADLQLCLERLRATGQIAPFPLGKHDLSEGFHIPQKLYGREIETQTLLDAFDRVSQGTAEIILVSGYSGVGKSALVNEIQKPVARDHGYFISGKFDQYKRNIPYASILQAFQELIQQILAESEARIASWKDTINAALGANGSVITDVLPDLKLIIGEQAPIPALGPIETQNRFYLVLQNFIDVFTQEAHPLVLFLDDLQWADSASLKLIQRLMTETYMHHLLLIGAYRDNEVTAAHPLMLTLEEIQQTDVCFSTITLQPLALAHVNQLLADTFGCEPQQAEPLAQAVFQKTLGNPFFLNQFLKSLHEERLLVFDRNAGAWQWDLDGVRQALATDNVVEFMASKLQKLGARAQDAIMRAACIGSRFDITLLSLSSGQSLSTTITDLGEAIQEGLVVPIDTDYHLLQSYTQGGTNDVAGTGFNTSCRFLHDRVQQAAYSLLPEEQRQQIHLTVGRQLLEHAGPHQREEIVFDIVNQMNIGIALISDPAERDQLAQLNLSAGKRARAATAYESAVAYLAAGMVFLDEASWTNRYELTAALHHERAMCEALIGNFDTAEQLFDTLLNHVRSKYEKAEVYVSRLEVYNNLGRFAEGVAVGLESLRLFDVTFPDTEEERGPAVGAAIMAVQTNLGGRKIEDLLDSPIMADVDKQMAMRLLSALVPHTFHLSQNLFVLAILEMVNLSLQYGHTDLSAQAYSFYGLFLSAAMGDRTSAYGFGKLAIDLNERFHNADLKGRIQQVFGGFIDHWRNHLRSSLAYLRQAYLDCLEVGDLMYASYACWNFVMHRLSKGDELHKVLVDLHKYLDFVQGTKNQAMVDAILMPRQVVLNLQGKIQDTSSLSDELFDERAFLERNQHPNNACLYSTFKLQILFMYEQYPEALHMAIEAEKLSMTMGGVHQLTELVLYYALTLAALYPTTAPADQQHYQDVLASQHKRMQAWAGGCPENFRAKELLIAAEIARISGDDHDAAEHYDQAINVARENESLHLEALAYELAAKYYLTKGRIKIAKLYMTDAYGAYMQWGATAKVQQLADSYAILLPSVSEIAAGSGSRPRTSTNPTTTDQGRGEQLDMATVIKAGQAISGEIVLDSLLRKLMQIVLENAGAQKGMLLLERDGQLLIEAKITVDPDIVDLHLGSMLETSADLPTAIIRYVSRAGEPLVLHNAATNGRFTSDAYVIANQSKSILCLPLIKQGRLMGLLYLENDLATHVFTSARLELLRLLSSQAAIAIENAQLYTNVQQMADDLRQAYEQLQHELVERQRAQEERVALQEEIIHAQKSVLAELSTPLIPITDHVMIMPLIGSLDSQRAQQILDALLEGTQRYRAQVVILDITGVPIVDTSVASMLIQAAQAVRLLGAQTFISGIRPEVAQTLVGLGVDLTGIITQGTLQSSIAYALQRSDTRAKMPQNGKRLASVTQAK
jgi:predicted ATPase/GAF domain-containing protein/anti-anti-sigma regulatory factor